MRARRLLMAGGEGGGKLLSHVARARENANPAALVVVCGRNAALKEKPRKSWPPPADADDVLGFRDEFRADVRAVRLLVTKAGPGTLAEAERLRSCRSWSTTTCPAKNAATSITCAHQRDRRSIALTTPRSSQSVEAHRREPRTARADARAGSGGASPPRGSSRRIAELIAQVAPDGRKPTAHVPVSPSPFARCRDRAARRRHRRVVAIRRDLPHALRNSASKSTAPRHRRLASARARLRRLRGIGRTGRSRRHARSASRQDDHVAGRHGRAADPAKRAPPIARKRAGDARLRARRPRRDSARRRAR